MQDNLRSIEMTGRQFRFAYFTQSYEETVAFYRDSLGMPVVSSWNRSLDDRGTLISAAGALIEVLALPNDGVAEHLFDDRPPQGAFMVVEVDRLEELYRRAAHHGLPIQQQLGEQSWGHRSFCLQEPNGLTLYFFTALSEQR
jgi:catechol 2,3-dioxygenase-like lactoylglutathione lyase family enzyme